MDQITNLHNQFHDLNLKVHRHPPLLVSKFEKKFKTHDLSVFSLKFVIFHKDILVTIPGMRSIYQVNQAIKALKTSNLNRAEVQRI